MTNLMKKLYYLAISLLTAVALLILSSISVEAQRFSTSTIQTNNFPQIKTNFVAKSPMNEFYTDLQDSDFQIYEYVDGVQYDVSATASVTCKDSEEKPEVNILLVLDASNSMTQEVEPGGETRFFYVKEAVKSFVDQIEMVGRTRISILVFGFNAIVTAPWTNDKEELKNSLEDILMQNATRYLPPINGDTDPASPNAKTLFDERPDDMPNIVIFLTDGKPSDGDVINEQVPGETFNRGDRAIQDMIDKNIIFYSIAIFNNMDPFLSTMSFKTNGKDFKIDSPEKIAEVYELLALEIQNSQTCELSWEAPFSCRTSDFNRKVDITLLRNSLTSSSNYNSGEQSLARINTDNESLFFGNPQLDEPFSVLKTISYTPENLDVKVSYVGAQPNTYYEVEEIRLDGNIVNDIPFTVPKESVLEVDVRFTQRVERVYRQADLVIEGEFCMPIISLFGGIDKVLLTGPVDEDIINICGPTKITWTGIPESAPIDITYSLDAGANWDLIASDATGLVYNWEPGFVDDKNDVLVKLFKKSFNSYLWATALGGPQKDSLTSMAITRDETTVFVSGSFEEEIRGNDGFLYSRGAKDAMIASFNSGGELNWLKTGGSPSNDETTGIVEFIDDIFAVGYTHNGFTFGGSTNSSLHPTQTYMFILRLDKNGVVKEQRLLGDPGGWTGFNLQAEGIRVQGNTLEVYCLYTGEFEGKLIQNQPQNIDLAPTANPRGVLLTFDIDNNNLRLLTAVPGNRDPSLFKVIEETTTGSQVTYNIDHFTDTKAYDSYDVVSAGGIDGVLTAYGQTPSSEDISDPFDIQRPILEFNIPNKPVDFTTVPLLDTETENFTAAIVNNSNLPVTIENHFFNPDDNVFKIISGLPITEPLEPGESIDLEISFTPLESRQYNASLEIESSCANPISLQITGLGECSLTATPVVTLNDYNVGSQDLNTVNAIFTNNNGGVIDVTPNIDNPEFRITSITTDAGLVLYDGTGALGTIGVPAKTTIDMIIEFAPTVLGLRTGNLTFSTETFCNDPVTVLEANGINAELIVRNLDFDIKRINTVNSGQVSVKNASSGNVSINNIDAATLPPEFSIASITNDLGTVLYDGVGSDLGTPYEIQADGEIFIDIIFSPTTEGDFSANLDFVQGNDEIISSSIEGIGSNPDLTVSYNCPNDPQVNQSYEIALNISNSSDFEATEIESVALSIGDDYKLLDGSGGTVVTQLTNISVPINGSTDIFVQYIPSSTSPPADQLNFVADIATGNFVDADVPSSTGVIEELDCTASNNLEPVDMTVNVLACYLLQTSLPVDNMNAQEMTINASDVVISGANPEVIQMASLTDVVIPMNTGSFAYPISIQVPDNGIYTVTIDLSNNSLNAQRIFNLVINGQYITIDSKDNSYSEEPGQIVDMVVVANIPPLDHPVDNLNFTMSYNPNVIGFYEEPVMLQPDWNFDDIKTQVDLKEEILTFTSTATPNGIVNGTIDLVELPMIFLLGSTVETNLDFQVFRDECSTQPVNQGATIITDWICEADSLRTVVTSGTDFNVGTIYPNPVTEVADLEINASWDMFCEISVVNSVGEKVGVLFDGILYEGLNNLNLDLTGFSTGLYNIVVTTPYNKDSRLIMIQR